MDMFPKDFSYEHSNSTLTKIITESIKIELEKYREYIYTSYKKTLGEKKPILYLTLDCSFASKKILLEELTKRFFEVLFYAKGYRDDDIELLKFSTSNPKYGEIYNVTQFYIILSSDAYYASL